MPPRALLLGCDGVLVLPTGSGREAHRRDAHLSSSRDAAAAYGLSFSEADFARFSRVPAADAFATLAAEQGVAGVDGAAVAARKAALHKLQSSGPPFGPALALAQQALASGAALAVVSGSRRGHAASVAAKLRLPEATRLFCAEDGATHGDRLAAACAALGLPPCDCLLLEADDASLAAATLLGMPCADARQLEGYPPPSAAAGAAAPAQQHAGAASAVARAAQPKQRPGGQPHAHGGAAAPATPGGLPPVALPNRHRGRVKSFSPKTCWGFVVPLPGSACGDEDVFVYQSEINMKGTRGLVAGALVDFALDVTPDGKRKARHTLHQHNPLRTHLTRFVALACCLSPGAEGDGSRRHALGGPPAGLGAPLSAQQNRERRRRGGARRGGRGRRGGGRQRGGRGGRRGGRWVCAAGAAAAAAAGEFHARPRGGAGVLAAQRAAGGGARHGDGVELSEEAGWE